MLPHLPNHKAIRASGPGKLHGLVILYNANRFVFKGSKTIFYDEEFTQGDLHEEKKGINPAGESEAEMQDRRKRWKKARGGTRQTKNIGLMAALEWIDSPGSGLVVGTTHLWVEWYDSDHVQVLTRSPSQFLAPRVRAAMLDNRNWD